MRRRLRAAADAGLSATGSGARPGARELANQIEIYFSIVQRKALTPNDFTCLQAVADRLKNFERYYESIAHPFEWKFTRADLNALMAQMRLRYADAQELKLAA